MNPFLSACVCDSPKLGCVRFWQEGAVGAKRKVPGFEAGDESAIPVERPVDAAKTWDSVSADTRERDRIGSGSKLPERHHR
jgi:hypothetical protein